MEVKCFILISLFSFFFYFFIFNKRKKISLALGTIDIPKNNRQIHSQALLRNIHSNVANVYSYWDSD